MKKILSKLLIAVLLISAVSVLPLPSYAAGSAADDPSNVRAIFYGSSSVIDTDTYSDEVFTKDPTVYDPQLAVMSLAIGSASCNTYRYNDDVERYTLMSRNVCELLEDTGFTDIYVNDDYRVKPDGTKAAAAFAHKKIIDDGKEYTLLVLIAKGGAMELEYKNVAYASKKEGDTGDFAYYVDLKDKILKSAREYIKNYDIKGDIKLWIPGYSKSGGVANIMAAEIIDDPALALGTGIKLDNSDIYCYSGSSYRTAEMSKDLKADKYKVIHHIISDDDIVVKLPWETMSFGWYGQVRDLKQDVDKAEAMRLLRANSESEYDRYVNSADPDLYSPMKMDISALLQGKLSMTEDDESYLPYDQGEYIDSIMEPLKDLFAEDAGNVRDGFYKNYQQPLTDFMTYIKIYGLPDTSAMLESKTAIPFVLSTYISYLADRRSDIRKEELNAAIEGAFNMLAYNAEDENGDLRSDFVRLSSTNKIYKLLRERYFAENSTAEYDQNGIPQKYSLTREIKNDSLFAKTIRKLSAVLYARTMNDILTAQGVDDELLAAMTSDEDSAAMSRLAAHIMFGNDRQSSSIRPINPDNEQFKQLATLIGNYKSCATLHYAEVTMSWLQADSGLYADYDGYTDAMVAGYRRVYINNSSNANVSGTVTDETGSVVAEFENGKMISRTDKWIGYTTSDSGGWLRLPLSHSYKVELTTDKTTNMRLKIADYSVYNGYIARTVTSDEKNDWTGIKTTAADKLTLDIPEVSAKADGSYDITSANYSLEITKGKTSSTIPKIKSVKLKAGKKAFTVKWKKLSAAQQKNVTKIQIQYSTSKKFKQYRTVLASKGSSSKKITGLKKGKTYYVRVRSIKYSNDKKSSSKWSAVKKVKTK